MGYFSNGTEGELYYEHYCARCIHDDEENGKYCSIWSLHLLHNYKECNNKESMLHVLIPRNKGGFNEICTMFVERPAMGDLFAVSQSVRMNKVSKDEVNYTDKGTAGAHCGICQHYQGRGECNEVDGVVIPPGWCNRFKADRWAPAA